MLPLILTQAVIATLTILFFQAAERRSQSLDDCRDEGGEGLGVVVAAHAKAIADAE